MKQYPPKWADRLLEWYCHPALLEEIQGDAHELFSRKAKENLQMAKLQFVWNVARFFRLKNIRKSTTTYSSNSFTMLKSYLTTAFRTAIRHPLNSSINILALSLALGIAITSFIFIDSQLHADHFHTNLNRIYQVTSRIEIDKQIDEWSDSPILLAPMMLQEQSIVEASTRILDGEAIVKYKDDVFNESLWFVDPSFLEIFSFPIVKGSKNPLANGNDIVLERKIAQKYFGDADPIGKSLSLILNGNVREEFTVTAVIERPAGSSLYATILLPMSKFNNQMPDKTNDWAYQVDGMFILLKKNHGVDELSKEMNRYVALQNIASPQWAVKDFQFQSLDGLALKSSGIISSVSAGPDPAALYSLGVIAILLLTLASLNYMNVSVATVATRLKEIGIRKVIGGQKKEIVAQFVTENFALCSVALLVGSFLSYLFLLPAFNSLFPVNLSFGFSSGNVIFLFFGALLLFIGVLSGAYPAFYIASFQPVKILAGREKFGQKSLFSRVLLTLQFIVAIITIVGSFVFIDNSIYLKNKDWGYTHSNIITVGVKEKSSYLALRDKLLTDPEIVKMAGAEGHIGRSDNRISFVHHEQRIEAIDFQVGYNYLETMSIRLKEGRLFDQKNQSDRQHSLVINETLVKKLGWTSPIGQSIELDSTKFTVIGVVEDFHYQGFFNKLGPVILRLTDEDKFNYLAIQTAGANVNDTHQRIKSAWASIAPDEPYEGFVQDDVFADFNRDNNANVKLLVFISTITVTLASLGLFGLISFNTTRRMKEYSIRKVLGADLSQIFRLMNGDYVVILLSAFVIGAPAGFLLINSLIQAIYPNPQNAQPLPFIIALLVILFTVAVTVSSQLMRIRRENPSTTLKKE